MDLTKIRVALAERGLRQFHLAKRLKISPSSLSDWLRGARTAPADLSCRIEVALGLLPGALSTPPDEPGAQFPQVLGCHPLTPKTQTQALAGSRSQEDVDHGDGPRDR